MLIMRYNVRVVLYNQSYNHCYIRVFMTCYICSLCVIMHYRDRLHRECSQNSTATSLSRILVFVALNVDVPVLFFLPASSSFCFSLYIEEVDLKRHACKFFSNSHHPCLILSNCIPVIYASNHSASKNLNFCA